MSYFDSPRLSGEEAIIAAVATSACLALGGVAAYFHARATRPASAPSAGATPPRVSKAQLLELLESSRVAATRAQADALRDVVSADRRETSRFARRSTPPSVKAVTERFRAVLAEADAVLFKTAGVKEADVDAALRVYGGDAAVVRAAAAIVALEPVALSSQPAALAAALGIEGDIDVDELDGEDEAAGGGGVLDATHTGARVVARAAVAALLADVTAAAPAHFRVVAQGVLQMSGGSPGPAFPQQVLALARNRATAAVLDGSPWEARPAAFDFVVSLHAAADAAFRRAFDAGLEATAARLQAALAGEDGGDGEDEGDGDGEGEEGYEGQE